MLANDLNMNGISNVVMNYCKELDKNKFDVNVIAGTPISEVYHQDACENNIAIWELPSRKKQTKQYYQKLWSVLKREKFDIVHVHGNSATITMELFLAWQSGTRVRIAHSHNTTCSNMKVHKLLYPFFSLLYTERFACSEMAGKWLFCNKPFTVIPNCFHTKNFVFNGESRKEIREKLHINDSDFVVGHIGRFNSQKNHEFLLQIFQKIAEIKTGAWLLLVGGGPDFNKVLQLIKQHPYKDRIIIYGESDETAKVYSAMDVFAFPSRYEGLGIVALEAQINGLPVVASEGVPKEVALGDELKFLSLQSALDLWCDTILNSTVSDRKQFYETYYTEIMRYDIDCNVKKLENTYQECIAKTCRRT